MRNTIVISLLILFTTSQAGYYCVYSFQQSQIKKEVKEHLKELLPKPALQVIIAEDFTNTIKWQEEGKEFILHGELYDVAEIKIINGKTLLYCINDKKEEKVLDQFAKAIKSSSDNNGSNKTGNGSYKFQLSDYYFFNNTQKMPPVNFNTSNKYLFFISCLTASVNEVNTPPPKA